MKEKLLVRISARASELGVDLKTIDKNGDAVLDDVKLVAEAKCIPKRVRTDGARVVAPWGRDFKKRRGLLKAQLEDAAQVAAGAQFEKALQEMQHEMSEEAEGHPRRSRFDAAEDVVLHPQALETLPWEIVLEIQG
jgi:hypothetical protein